MADRDEGDGGERTDEIERIAAFVRAHPRASRHVFDLPYRLASHAAQNPANRRVWLGSDGEPRAYALAQTPMWTLDYALANEDPVLERAILIWGIERWREVAAKGGPLTICVDVAEGDAERQALFESLGFSRFDWQQHHLAQPLPAPAPAPAEIAPGFAIRPLDGAAEVEGYVALHRVAFGSENMTVAWRRQTLAMPEYRPELDVVAVAPGGRLAGFCIGWLAMVDGRAEAQIEPMGVHPDFQRRGLGRALIREALRRFAAAGAERAHLEVDGDNPAALALYTGAGFAVEQTYLKYGRRP